MALLTPISFPVGFEPVPTIVLNTKIIRLSNVTLPHPPPEFPYPVTIAKGESHLMDFPTHFRRTDHPTGLNYSHRQRFLTEHVFSIGKCSEGLLCMFGIGCADGH